MKLFKKWDGQRRRTLTLISVLTIIASITAGATLAYITLNSRVTKNDFKAAMLDVSISEDFEQGGTVKKDVKIENTATAAAYIRAAVVIGFKDEDGAVYAQTPKEGTDYSISFGEGWLLRNDGFYYCKTPVAPGKATGNLINECKALSANDGGFLDVQILAEAIQASPADAVQGAWGVTLGNDGSIIG